MRTKLLMAGVVLLLGSMNAASAGEPSFDNDRARGLHIEHRQSERRQSERRQSERWQSEGYHDRSDRRYRQERHQRERLERHAPPPQTGETLQLSLERRYHHESLPLRHLFRLGREYEGAMIARVDIDYSRPVGRTRVSLLNDNRAVDEARARRKRHSLSLVPRRDLRIDDGLGRVRLAIDGELVIHAITVHLAYEPDRGRRQRRHRDYWRWPGFIFFEPFSGAGNGHPPRHR